MNTLSTADTKFVSGGYLLVGQQKPQQHPRFMAMETTALDADANSVDDYARHMAPAVVTETLVPPAHFDADRIAPSRVDNKACDALKDRG